MMELPSVLLALFVIIGAVYCECPEDPNGNAMSCCGAEGGPLHYACLCSATDYTMERNAEHRPFCLCPSNINTQCCLESQTKKRSLASLYGSNLRRYKHEIIERSVVETNVDAVNAVLANCETDDYSLTLAGLLYDADLIACSDAIYSTTSTAKQIKKKCKLLDKKLKVWPTYVF